MLRVIFDFGTFNVFGYSVTLRIYGYGLMLVLGFLLSIAWGQWRARRVGEDPEVVGRIGLIAVVMGILGARVAFVIEQWDQYRNAGLGEMVNITSGGLIYYGGLILAGVSVAIYLALKRVPVRRYLDVVAPVLMLGLAFGRAGCLLNGCCFGGQCNHGFIAAQQFPMYATPIVKVSGDGGPFAPNMGVSPVYQNQFEQGLIEPDVRLMTTTADGDKRILDPSHVHDPKALAAAGLEWSLPVKASQAIGLINGLLLAALLAGFHRLRSREGQTFALLAILYPITGFFEELIRNDNPHDLLKGVLTHNQVTSMVLLVGGVIMMVCLRRVPPSLGPGLADRLAAATASNSPRRQVAAPKGCGRKRS